MDVLIKNMMLFSSYFGNFSLSWLFQESNLYFFLYETVKKKFLPYLVLDIVNLKSHIIFLCCHGSYTLKPSFPSSFNFLSFQNYIFQMLTYQLIFLYKNKRSDQVISLGMYRDFQIFKCKDKLQIAAISVFTWFMVIGNTLSISLRLNQEKHQEFSDFNQPVIQHVFFS